MSKLSLWFCVTALILSGQNSFAKNKSIYRGNWEVSGGFGAEYKDGLGLYLRASPAGKYFLIDRLAVGLSSSLFLSGTLSNVGVGPEVSYYFYETEKMAMYFSQGLQYAEARFLGNNKDQFSSFSSKTSFGMAYFLNENVSFGPELTYTTYFNEELNNQLADYGINDEFSFMFNFKIFL